MRLLLTADHLDGDTARRPHPLNEGFAVGRDRAPLDEVRDWLAEEDARLGRIDDVGAVAAREGFEARRVLAAGDVAFEDLTVAAADALVSPAELNQTLSDLRAGIEERVEEIARMLAGTRITERTLAHAREMLEGR